MTPTSEEDALFAAMRAARAVFQEKEIEKLFTQVSQRRVKELSEKLGKYIAANLPETISRRSSLPDYRTNPYVLMTCGSAMNLDDPRDFAHFLVNNKLYMGLETSFGKSIESIVMGMYPVSDDVSEKWEESKEKMEEFSVLRGLSREDRARARAGSVWREIDKSCVVGKRRYLATVKSGPNTINDTQVNAMKDAIRDNHATWLTESKRNYGVEGIDIVIGLTYGTPKTTNNKDNQLIVKLLESGFEEEDRTKNPGVIRNADGSVRVYRVIGTDFWSFVARPDKPKEATFAFLEVLIALAIALRSIAESKDVEDRLNDRLQMLAQAISTLRFPKNSLPKWIKKDFQEQELFWLASAMTAFYDEGL